RVVPGLSRTSPKSGLRLSVRKSEVLPVLVCPTTASLRAPSGLRGVRFRAMPVESAFIVHGLLSLPAPASPGRLPRFDRSDRLRALPASAGGATVHAGWRARPRAEAAGASPAPGHPVASERKRFPGRASGGRRSTRAGAALVAGAARRAADDAVRVCR